MGIYYSYPELQRKFCEGFGFLPFSNLEQSGSSIYKRYSPAPDLKKTIDCVDQDYALESLHPQMLLLMLQQRNIPLAEALLQHLEQANRLFGSQCSGKHLLFYGHILEVIRTYRDILYVFQRDVLRNIELQLECPGGRPADINANSVHHIQVIVTELINSTVIIHEFLNNSISGNSGEKPALTGITEDILDTLTRKLKQFTLLMEKMVYILKQWEQQILQMYRKQTMN
ncbi:MAG TPA: hypothetical protein VFS25_25150 [Chitinophaga sp.]|uniref:hypothetical protein n=1 Tax=Chitinophaga sp. TaxID=1869181 RepID=UPI002DB9A0FD|nr:hypothetical protein [Chitinophaga sp.]HEU4556159.1 hypothetical protein [Chitinophaga sp.]